MLESYRNAGILWESYYPTGIHETRLSNAMWMGNTIMYTHVQSWIRVYDPTSFHACQLDILRDTQRDGIGLR